MQTGLGQNIVDSISAKDIGEILLELGEAEIDTLLDNELLKDIPFVGIFAKALGASQKISNAIFAKKILKFLGSANAGSEEKKHAFKERMDKEQKTKKRVGQTLMILIDRMDDITKCEILGNLFRAYMDQKIDYLLFLRFSSMIDKIFIPDLIKLKGSGLTSLDVEIKELLTHSGIVKSHLENNREFEDHIREQMGAPGYTAPVRYKYELTEFGKSLLNYAFYSPIIQGKG